MGTPESEHRSGPPRSEHRSRPPEVNMEVDPLWMDQAGVPPSGWTSWGTPLLDGPAITFYQQAGSGPLTERLFFLVEWLLCHPVQLNSMHKITFPAYLCGYLLQMWIYLIGY